MKKLMFALAFSLMAVCSFAQNLPAGMRFEVAEIEEDEQSQFTVFKYKDDDGSVAYDMSVAYRLNVLGLFRDDITSMTIDHLDETCLCLGADSDEAMAFLNGLLDLLDEAPGTVAEFECRKSAGAEQLGDYSTAACIVMKRFFGKRLKFGFESRNRTAETEMTRSAIKSLIATLKINKTLHPDW